MTRAFTESPLPTPAHHNGLVHSGPSRQAEPGAPDEADQARHALPALAMPQRGAVGGLSADVAAMDIDDLMAAVVIRLRSVVDPLPESDGGPSAEGVLAVRDCAGALDQLRQSLAHQFSRLGQLEQAVGDAQSALAAAVAELSGTQADEHHARHLALHDGLTSLPNRRMLKERLDQALAGLGSLHGSLALMYLDIDDFKQVNDQHGHAVGDEVLRIVAARLSRTLRARDLMCRLGGDEFACLLLDWNNPAQLGRVASKLMAAVAAPLQVGELTFSLRLSIGIAVAPVDGRNSESLLGCADAGMYRAKRRHTGYAFFEGFTGN